MSVDVSNFLFFSKDSVQADISTSKLISEFEKITSFDVDVVENNRFILAYDKSHSSVCCEVNGTTYLLLGSAIHENVLVDSENLGEIVGNLIENRRFSSLSGRFVLIKVSEDSAFIVDSIFSSFPHYTYDKGNIHSSSLLLLNSILDLKISLNALKERVLYFSNYGKSMINNVLRTEPASVYDFSDSVTHFSYLEEVLNPNFGISLTDAAVSIASRMEELISIYFPNEEDISSLSFTGGRDSRLLLCQLLKVVGSERVKLYTVGNSTDTEYSVGRKFSSHYDVEHNLFSPRSLVESDLNEYSLKIGNINFPCQYKNQYINYLSDFEPVMINTAIPETLLCHLAYFEGENHPAINFLINRGSEYRFDNIIDGNLISEKAYNDAIAVWDRLESYLPNTTATKLFFELTTYQRDWVYNILRVSDYSGKTVCIMEDPIILSILASCDESWLCSDLLYEHIISHCYPELYLTPTTRQLSGKNVLGLKVSDMVSSSDVILNSFFDVSSLGYLTELNQDFLVNGIVNNPEYLKVIFSDEFLFDLTKKIKNGKYTKNRLYNLIKRKLISKYYVREYDLIVPICMIYILKNYKWNN